MEFEVGVQERKSNDDEDDDSLKRCTRGFYRVEKVQEESKSILVTWNPKNGVKCSLGRLLPKTPRQMARTLNVHSTLLIVAPFP